MNNNNPKNIIKRNKEDLIKIKANQSNILNTLNTIIKQLDTLTDKMNRLIDIEDTKKKNRWW